LSALPANAAPQRVRVVVELPTPPLAARGERGLAQAGTLRRLDTHSQSSRAYVRNLERRQAVVAHQIRSAIPAAAIGRRFTVVLDALTVSLPVTQIPTLLANPSVAKIYPSVSYRLATNRSPALIGADALRAGAGADGKGIKIAVVDDGIDQANPFFDPSGFAYPAGFPQGGMQWTTPKVIVARVFPGPNAGAPGRLAVDPGSSFHGTHVAGIAAGVSGTTAPAGADHPTTTGLSGVAPRAWLGNYRVFTVPTPIGHVANTPEIIAAFEAAVKDGMNVVNFSGGGPQIDPQGDALITAVHNLAAAGVVPVISAGNDRDDFGIGSTGSPGTAPDAIAVAATSNAHVFAFPLSVTAADAPPLLKHVPFQGANSAEPPAAWSSSDRTLVDVGSITGTDGKQVERHLCGRPGELDRAVGTLPAASLNGTIALVDRGLCPLAEKAEQAKLAGATGIIYADNREGEANVLGFTPPIPGGSIANLDAARLRQYMSSHGGRATIRVARDHAELDQSRASTVTSFSSAGPTAFGHTLSPDVSAPGGQILSSTLPKIDDSRFAVFDGTSMAAPHVTGVVAQLLQLHPAWTPQQVKSALVATAGPAWSDTAMTTEAPVTFEGGGIVSATAAASPFVFTFPTSLSFGDLETRQGAASRTLLVRIADAGGGDGTWSVGLQAQSAQVGTSVDLPGAVTVPPGGEATLTVTARAAAGTASGEDYGFVVLRKGAATRRIPYLFLPDNALLAGATVLPLRREQVGTTVTGDGRVQQYRYPAAPFGNQPDRPPMVEIGMEKVYRLTLAEKAVNAGVSILETSNGAEIDPFFLGSLDEGTVQGFAGTPVDVNSLTYNYLSRVGAAGASFPRAGTYYIAVDSGRGEFDGKSLAGRYVLRSWVNDLKPPALRLLTTRVWAGRPTLVFRALDTQSGVDPATLTIGYKGALVSVGSFDWRTGIAAFPLPSSVPALKAGTSVRATMIASDFQESKNVDAPGDKIMPNTRTSSAQMRVVAGIAVDWLAPVCLRRGARAVVAAGGPATLKRVRFYLDGKAFASDRTDDQGIWSASIGRTVTRGRHVLLAIGDDRKGRSGRATATLRACSP
jgi:minor extracellular serine protease Vpr